MTGQCKGPCRGKAQAPIFSSSGIASQYAEAYRYNPPDASRYAAQALQS